MFILALKKIISKRARTLLTSLGICFSTVLLIISIYYLYVGKEVVSESFKQINAEQRIVFQEVSVCGASYYSIGDKMLEDIQPIKENIITNILSHPGVNSIAIEYFLDSNLYLQIDDVKGLVYEEAKGVDTRFEVFSKALVDVIKDKDNALEEIVEGRSFRKGDRKVALISETTTHYLGFEPNEVIGKTLAIQDESNHQYEVEIIGVYAHELSGYYREELSNIRPYREGISIPSYAVEFIFPKELLEEINDNNSSDKLYPDFVKVTVDDLSMIKDLVSMLHINYNLGSVSDYIIFFESFDQQAKSDKLFLLLGILILILSILIVVNTMIINISEQRQFISLLMILGYRISSIQRVYILQSLLYGLMGAISGGIIGYLVSFSIGASIINRYKDIIKNGGMFILPLSYALGILLIILFMCIFVGLCTSFVVKSMERKMGYLQQEEIV